MKMPEGVNNPDDLEFNAQFVKAYDVLENTQKSVFVTGRAGTGKSTLLQYFRHNTIKKVVVLAPTGVAAVNVKGQTIHSFFRFKTDITPETVPNIRLRGKQTRIYRKLDAIVIDEISMVRADLLDCVDTFLRMYGKNPDAAFGGIQMIFIGDLYQLPPVVPPSDRDLFRNHYASPYFFDANAYGELEIQHIELQKVYRQRDDYFIKLLNTIRNNTARDVHLNAFNQRCQPQFTPNQNDFYIYLTTTNAMADQVNLEQLNRLKADRECFDGETTGEFGDRSFPTHKRLILKVGAQVMLLNNDPQGRWINGSVGKIISFDSENSSEGIKVELSDESIVEIMPFTWEIFRFFFNEETKGIDSENVGSFTQFPLKLAWAVTIHKSQGKTFSKVVIDIGRGTFAHGQLYVALSRCTHFEGIILKRPILKRHIILDKNVVAFLGKCRDNSPENIQEIEDDQYQDATQFIES